MAMQNYVIRSDPIFFTWEGVGSYHGFMYDNYERDKAIGGRDTRGPFIIA